MGAHNSVVGADQGVTRSILGPHVSHCVPIPGVTGSAHRAVRSLEGPRDHRAAPPARSPAPPEQPTSARRRGPGPARCGRGSPVPTAASRLARHTRDPVALAPTPQGVHANAKAITWNIQSLSDSDVIWAGPSNAAGGHRRSARSSALRHLRRRARHPRSWFARPPRSSGRRPLPWDNASPQTQG